MSIKVSVHQLQDRLPEFVQQVMETGREYVVQRNGKGCAVLISADQWKRRKAAARLDALGAAFRLSRAKQARSEELLEAQAQRRLTLSERRELRNLLRECDHILRRRAEALALLS